MSRATWISLALTFIVVACTSEPAPSGAGPNPSTGGASPSAGAATPGAALATTPPPTILATDTPTAAPTATPAEPARPDPATFLQVCRAADLAKIRPVPCADVVEVALAAPELAGARLDRVETGGSCDPALACGRVDAGPGAWVTVLSDRDPLIIRVMPAADGGLSVTEVHAAIRPAMPAFAPPASGLAKLPGAPASLAGRPAYPLCGTEQAPMGGPYDEAARTCFLTGVLAGSPVELASLGAGTEGAPFVALYRYAGAGGIEVVTGEGGAWTRRFTGIADAAGGLVFDIGGMSGAPEPVP
jgi:hypothetical protein